MAKKRVDRFDYKTAQKKLETFGWKLPAKTKGQKSKLKTFWKTKAAYVNHLDKDRLVDVITGVRKNLKRKKGKQKITRTSKLEYRFKFQKLTAKQQRIAKASKLFSDEQFSPKGIFIERPLNIKPKDYKVSFKGNSVEITADCRHDEIVLIDSAELAVDPEKAIQSAIDSRQCMKGKKKKTVRTYSLMVNGFRSKHSSSSAKAFMWYLKNKLLPEWLEKNEEEDEAKFSDIFHMRLIY